MVFGKGLCAFASKGGLRLYLSKSNADVEDAWSAFGMNPWAVNALV